MSVENPDRSDEVPTRDDDRQVSRAIAAIASATTIEQVAKLTATAMSLMWKVLAMYALGNRARLVGNGRQIRLIFVLLGVYIGGIGWVIYHNGNQHHADTIKIAQAQVSSRYDTAFISCLTADNANRQANQMIVKTLKHPDRSNIQALVDALRPFRSTSAPPPPGLPAHIPQAWSVACAKYAKSQIAVHPSTSTSIPHGLSSTLTTTFPGTKTS